MKVVTGTYQGHVEYLQKAIDAVLGNAAWRDRIMRDGRLRWTYKDRGEKVAYLYARPVGDIVECQWEVNDLPLPQVPQVTAVDFMGHEVWIDARHAPLGASSNLLPDGIADLLWDHVLPMINAGTWSHSDGVADRFDRYRCWPTEAQARAYYEQQADARMADLVSKFDDILAMTPLRLMEQQLRELEEGLDDAIPEVLADAMQPDSEPARSEASGEAVGELVRQWKAGEVTDLDLLRGLSELGIDVLELPGVHQGTSSKPAKQAELLGLARRYLAAKHYDDITQRDFADEEITSERKLSRAVALFQAIKKLA